MVFGVCFHKANINTSSFKKRMIFLFVSIERFFHNISINILSCKGGQRLNLNNRSEVLHINFFKEN